MFKKPVDATGLRLDFYGPDFEHTMFFEIFSRKDTRHQVVIPIERTGAHYIEVGSHMTRLPESGNEYSMHISGQAPPLQSTPPDSTDTTTSSPQTIETSTAASGTEASPQTDSSANSSTSSTGTPVEEKSINTLGPGFTSVGALLALFVTVLVAHRRR